MKKINKSNQTPKGGEAKQNPIKKAIKGSLSENFNSAQQATVKKIPAYWENYPEWFKENTWLVEHQEHLFVKRLGNTIGQIQIDMNIKSPDDTPMAATKACLLGDVAADATRFQYSEAKKQITTFQGDDIKHIEAIMAQFKETFKDYIAFLEN